MRFAMFLSVAMVTAVGGSSTAFAQESVSAAERMLAPGVEERELASGTGTWDVVSTLWLTPDGDPIVSSGLVAERTMIGNYQQEVMKPAAGADVRAFQRVAYLHYFRVEGCWQYVSMDTRFPVGIMPARTCEQPRDGTLTLHFESLPFVGLGAEVEGRAVNSNLQVIRDGPDHEFVRQYWTRADGTGRRWLAVQYEYTRRR